MSGRARRGMSAADKMRIAADRDATRATLIERLVRLAPEDRIAVLRQLSTGQRRALHEHWPFWALPGQQAPAGDWRVWLIRAGRGFGKTRAGAEWVSAVARAQPEARIAIVGGTMNDVERVMVKGQSGLIAVMHAGEHFTWRSDAGEFAFASGARAYAYSAEAPETLRGPEHHVAWCDEVAKWRNGDATWDNLMMGLRIGDAPRVLVTTTPRPVPVMRRIMALDGLVERCGRTADNPYLPARFVEGMMASYGGTRLGRQELDGELIEDIAGALWTRAMLEACRVARVPATVRVVVAVDPPAGSMSGQGGDACGIIAVARGADACGYVLEDASVVGASPEGWARAVAACAERHGADRVVAERNQGGDMVRSVLHAADSAMPLTLMHASKGKTVRAEPVAALYERGRVRHVGTFPALEDELCGLIAGGEYQGPGRSPDRADALVWAMTELMLGRRDSAAVRAL